jgi:hypothetical protein
MRVGDVPIPECRLFPGTVEVGLESYQRRELGGIHPLGKYSAGKYCMADVHTGRDLNVELICDMAKELVVFRNLLIRLAGLASHLVLFRWRSHLS